MVLWIGVDDTDSLRGMCTTFLATELVRELTREYDLIGYPRLVRLNPNIPWKTRGNGAVCLRVGRGRGTPQAVGSIGGRDVFSYPRAEGSLDPRPVKTVVSMILERWAEFEEPSTNPGFVVFGRRPPPSLYWRAVRGVVPLQHVLGVLDDYGEWRGYKNGRGLIGAAAATAWRPIDRTYEFLAYRKRSAWGTFRHLDPDSVLTMDRKFPSTFSNVDSASGLVAIAPHSPCPVLYGVRGDDPRVLAGAAATLSAEVPDRWLLFETNQGTDDHILAEDWSLRPGSAVALRGIVAEPPRNAKGGHVFVAFKGRREVDLAFYEPSKTFRLVARALRTGDALRVWGSVREDGRSLNVEKLRVYDLVLERKKSNPPCPRCRKSMKSAGRGQGFRCPRDGARAPPRGVHWVEIPRSLSPGWYEPPAYARRHLAKPIRRILRPDVTPPQCAASETFLG